MVWRLRNYASDRVCSDFHSSRIVPQGTVVTRFELVELSGAMLLALARRGTRAKVNSAELVCDRLVLFVFDASMSMLLQSIAGLLMDASESAVRGNLISQRVA